MENIIAYAALFLAFMALVISILCFRKKVPAAEEDRASVLAVKNLRNDFIELDETVSEVQEEVELIKEVVEVKNK